MVKSEHVKRVLVALRRASRALSVDARRLKTRHHVTPPQLKCLRALERGRASNEELAEAIGHSSVTISRLLERLATQGLVERQYPHAELTEMGRELVKEAPPPAEFNLAVRLEKRSPEEQERLAEALELVVELLEAQDLPESWSDSTA